MDIHYFLNIFIYNYRIIIQYYYYNTIPYYNTNTIQYNTHIKYLNVKKNENKKYIFYINLTKKN